MGFIIVAILAIIFLLLWAFLDIVPQAEARVIERLGMFRAVWGAGIHIKIPIIDKAVVPHIDLREQILELPKEDYGYGAVWGNANLKSKYRTRFKSPEVGFSSDSFKNLRSKGKGNYAQGDRFSKDINRRFSTKLAEGSHTEGYARNVLMDNIGHSRYSADGSASGGYYTYMPDDDIRDVITKDNVRMNVDVAVFYQVTDPKQYAYGMKQPLYALQKLTITTLRNISGELELDETLCSRDLINSKVRSALDEATDTWGVKITRVEIESILPPPQIQAAMEQQATAERIKRATILEAEGAKQAAILAAEADKQQKILEAEAIEQAAILKAKGEAEALLQMKEAEAKSLAMLNKNAPNESVIRLKAIQAMEEVADGNATKIIIPSEMQGLVGLANGLVEGAR